MRHRPCALITASVGVAVSTASLFGWGGDIHSGIVHVALTAIPADDHILGRWGLECGGFVNTFKWGTGSTPWYPNARPGTQAVKPCISQASSSSPTIICCSRARRAFQHMIPDVQATYRPYFLRALQALRTESPANAARWTGALLHFVTDTGSPPHAIALSGDAHTKMENWLDPYKIDLGDTRRNCSAAPMRLRLKV